MQYRHFSVKSLLFVQNPISECLHLWENQLHTAARFRNDRKKNLVALEVLYWYVRTSVSTQRPKKIIFEPSSPSPSEQPTTRGRLRRHRGTSPFHTSDYTRWYVLKACQEPTVLFVLIWSLLTITAAPRRRGNNDLAGRPLFNHIMQKFWKWRIAGCAWRWVSEFPSDLELTKAWRPTIQGTLQLVLLLASYYKPKALRRMTVRHLI